MSTIDEQIIKEEEAKINKQLQKGTSLNIDNPQDDLDSEDSPMLDGVSREIEKIEREKDAKVRSIVNEKIRKELKKPRLVKVEGPVDAVVKFPDIFKVWGIKTLHAKLDQLIKLSPKIPEIFKVEGRVKADVTFPKVQKVDVDFPDIQKVQGNVIAEVNFPDVQKIQGDINAGFEFVQGAKFKAIPVVFTDGEKLLSPFDNKIEGNGRLTAALERLASIGANNLSSVAYSGLSNTLQTVKASAGKFGGYFYDNPNSSRVYLQVFFDRDSVTLGTTAPDAIYGIPASGAANVPLSRDFNKRMQIAATTQPNGATAPTTPIPATIYIDR